MQSLIPIFQLLHSWTRWIFLVVAVVAIAYFVLGLAQRKPWVRQGQSLLSVFSGLVGLQWVLGLVLFLLYQVPSGFDIRHQWEHLAAMTVVLGVAHVHYAWRRREMADARRWRNGLLLMVGVLVLIVVGISVLPAAIQWRFYIPA
jgi:hypothetical protein